MFSQFISPFIDSVMFLRYPTTSTKFPVHPYDVECIPRTFIVPTIVEFVVAGSPVAELGWLF